MLKMATAAERMDETRILAVGGGGGGGGRKKKILK